MTETASENPAVEQAPGNLWVRVPVCLLYISVASLLYLGLNLAVLGKGTIPDYDGLSYINSALRVSLGLFGGSVEHLTKVGFSGSVSWAGLPFTNTLDVLIVALLYNLLDYHLSIWLLHSGYLLLFVYFLRKIYSPAVALLLFLWAVSYIYFLHQYTNLISEMKVGMFLMLFIAFLFHEDVAKHLKSLFWIIVILLFLRIINLFFILPLVVVYVAIRWREVGRRSEVVKVLKTIGLVFLILSPFLLYEVRYLIPHLLKSGYSDMVQNWRDMSGIYNIGDLFRSYATGIASYNRVLAVVALIAVCCAGALCFTPARRKLAKIRDISIGVLVVFAILMQAQSNNIMVVYWPYILIGMLVVSLAAAFVKETHLVIVACLAVPFAIALNYFAFVHSVQKIAYGQPLNDLAKELSSSMAGIEKPVMYQNYAGLGVVDHDGLELAGNRILAYPILNRISYKTDLSDYLSAFEGSNVAFIANRNFMWPKFLGINHKTEEIANFVSKKAGELGFIKSKHLNFDSDPTQFVDVYVRPTLQIKLKYLRYNDKWLDAETSLLINAAGSDKVLSNYKMELDVVVPATVDPNFALPLKASLVGPGGIVGNVVLVDRVGPTKLVFDLDAVTAGAYRLQFDKTFAPPNDPRKLSAIYVDSTIRYVPKKINSIAEIK